MPTNSALGGTPKLYYFDIGASGRGENLRVLFADAGIQYDQKNLPLNEEWVAFKEDLKKSGKNPAGTVPVLELNGESHFGTLPLLRYLAAKLGAYKGKTPEEDLFIDSVSDFVADWRSSWVAVFLNEKDKAAYAQKELPNNVEVIEKLLGKYDGPYFLGDNFTYADILAYQIVHDEELLDKLQKYPNLVRLKDAVEARPRLAEYFSQRE
ncbi:putative glutathione S-transferase [Basidiobolus meristosporus CBS 931.73]|uniref:Putative glutathione S-transferase n=1 Tax=Basidiobolus meristosporus CBS 931.73 TaxID=1314790 RepID=A0A1Y1XUG1_9FUNG|nr:putative glutathione S-transferase [Basidiobolus meristosporus CBS 931.73]|eukprot:ORX89407.1 putative glutathione S-transferase [Basidiobolus meristosporus CBS 931.73]